MAPSMIEAISRAHAFAPAATPLVVYGESGTGKTFFAEYIHELSGRAGGFHPFSVGLVAPQLALDELFGHVKGAYTDAKGIRAGRIATASGGSLLLDDIQTLDLGVQKQLLQVFDRGTYSPVGSDRILSVACRFILAMTEAPDQLMRQGVLLKDLRYRFGACAIRLPPLRERRDEIPLLVHHALAACESHTKLEGPSRFDDGAIALLQNGRYEGNVRQLCGVVEYGYLMARTAGKSEIQAEDLPLDLVTEVQYKRHGDPEQNRVVVENTLQMTGGNVKAAARLLGVSRNTLNSARSHRR